MVLFLAGGADTWNLVVPVDGCGAHDLHAKYEAARGAAAKADKAKAQRTEKRTQEGRDQRNKLFSTLVEAPKLFKALKDAAIEARAAGDLDTYDTKGREAFQELEAAFRSVEDWELRIIDDYGSQDGQVRAILKEITRWKKARDKFIKLPGIVDGPGSADRE